MVLRRTLAAQALVRTLQNTPEHDTLPAGVAQVARTCGARFTAANTSIADLPDLISLALLENNDTLARNALAHFIAAQPTDSAQIRTMLDAVEWYLEAEPARVVAADSLIAQLDTRRQADGAASIVAHGRMLDFGHYNFDRARMRHEAEWIIEHAHHLTAEQLMTYKWDRVNNPNSYYRNSWGTLVTLAYVDQPSMVPNVARRAQQDYQRMKTQGMFRAVPNYAGARKEDSAMTTMAVDKVIDALLSWTSQRTSGETPPPLRAAYWFPASHDSVQPRPGTTTLLIKFPCQYFDVWGPDASCTIPFLWLQQLVTRYGTSHLAITVVASTVGHSLLSGPQSPADEAHDLAWYVQDYWHLPVTVAVQQTPFTIQPLPDGRHLYAQDEFSRTYGLSDGMVLIGKDGTILYKGALIWSNPWHALHVSSRDENMTQNTVARENYVEAMLHQQLASYGTTVSSSSRSAPVIP